MEKEYTNDLGQILAAYEFFYLALPSEKDTPIECSFQKGIVNFQTGNQIHAMKVELGWAFFTRLDACFDALIEKLKKKNLIKTKKNEYYSIEPSELSQEEIDGLKKARALRNILHHGDGNKELSTNTKSKHILKDIHEGNEPHLLINHIRKFHDLYHKIGIKLINKSIA